MGSERAGESNYFTRGDIGVEVRGKHMKYYVSHPIADRSHSVVDISAGESESFPGTEMLYIRYKTPRPHDPTGVIGVLTSGSGGTISQVEKDRFETKTLSGRPMKDHLIASGFVADSKNPNVLRKVLGDGDNTPVSAIVEDGQLRSLLFPPRDIYKLLKKDAKIVGITEAKGRFGNHESILILKSGKKNVELRSWTNTVSEH